MLDEDKIRNQIYKLLSEINPMTNNINSII